MLKWTSRSSLQTLKMPSTQIYHLLDDQMTLIVRAWGSQEFNQKLVEEVSSYLSSAQADLDVTSPFDFKENLSSLANRTRIALLLAQDFFYKTQNKNEFSVGFETVVFFQNKSELAWSSVGRFGLKLIRHQHAQTLFEAGTDRDEETLLPTELLGVESEVEINSGSILLNSNIQLVLSSIFGGDINIEVSKNDQQVVVQPSNHSMTYWYSLITVD